MGIPSFYRWLIDRYPLAVEEVIEEVPPVVNGVRVPIDTIRKNPNGMEFDNLYLDMNGIIHPCFHPEDKLAPKTYEEIFKNVFKYIDHIFSIIRPRKLLYMAVDGVAPRAKMNQQRTRRFRAAKDRADEAAEAERLSSVHGKELESLDKLDLTKTLDSNVITPGTEFMALLSSALQYYIHLRVNTDPGWRGIKVILSDANVPGEGEHKIMSYIRLQRNLPGFDPNTRHCLYGLDADLIMLALATHEVHFTILRENVSRKPKLGKWSSRSGQKTRGKKLTRSKVDSLKVDDDISMQQFQFLNIWILRDYLAHEMRIPDRTVKTDFERLIDDFVFMCLFVGNDFLPHVPSLEISEGAIDLLMAVYKMEFVKMGGYLTNSFEVNLERVEHFLQAVGSHENAIFRKRSQTQKEDKKRGRSSDSSKLPHAKRLKNSESFWSSVMENTIDEKKTPISISNEASYDADAVVDKVKLGERGWKVRFYTEKFETETKDDQEKIRSHAVFKYIEGICWVMHYYYQGVCSWQWFYPYHYAPFASDFYGIGRLEIQFTLGEPFKPLNQLMSVLPAASAHALPIHYRALMTDSTSPISDFYPTDFELDMNGKRHAWQAVCKLPFIMESRLLAEIAKLTHTLTDEEKRRNSLGMDVLFVHISHPLTLKIFSLLEQKKDHLELPNAEVEHIIDPKLSNGMNGYIYISDKPVLPLEIYSPIEDMEMITKNETICVFYKFPTFHSHVPRLPEGVSIPAKSVRSQDVAPAPVLWHEKLAVFGRRFSERPIPKSISGPCLAKSARRLVSEHYLMKQSQTLGSTQPKGHVTLDGSGRHPSSKVTVHEKELNHGEAISIKLTKNQKKIQRKKRAKERRSSMANGLVSEQMVGSAEPNGHITADSSTGCSKPKERVGKKELDHNDLSRTIGDVPIDFSMHQPNSEKPVLEKGPDHGEQSKSQKRKRVRNKFPNSMANELVSGSFPIGHQVVMDSAELSGGEQNGVNGVVSETYPTKPQQAVGSAEPNGHVTAVSATRRSTPKERAGLKELDHNDQGWANVDVAIDCSMHQPNSEGTVRDKGLDHAEESGLNGGKSRKRKWVREKCRNSMVNGLVSEQAVGSAGTVVEKGPDHGEQSCLNWSIPRKKNWVKKKRGKPMANGLVSESSPTGQQVVMGSTELNGHVTTGGSIRQQHSKEAVHEKELNHGEASSSQLIKNQKKRQRKKRAKERQRSIANGLESEQSCLNGSKPRKIHWVKKKRGNSMANGLASESCPIDTK